MLLEKEKFYVYLHRRASDGVVFYVGKGTGIRAYSRNRSKHWVSFIGNEPYEILFEKINLSENEAIDLESSLINNPREGWQLVNKSKSAKNKAINYDLVSEYLYYDETSPSCLRWKKSVGNKGTPSFKSPGDVAGSLHSNRNRYTVTIKGTLYYIHRIVVVLHGIEIPDGYVINHKDCKSNNNKISNLEVVSCAVNAQKKSDYVYEKDKTGVRVVKTLKGWSVHARYVDINGKRISKALYVAEESEVQAAKEELLLWRNEQVENKLKILMDTKEN